MTKLDEERIFKKHCFRKNPEMMHKNTNYYRKISVHLTTPK